MIEGKVELDMDDGVQDALVSFVDIYCDHILKLEQK